MGEVEVAAFRENSPHIAICPSAGIGHLIPFLRLASLLSSSNCNCNVTLITIQPTLSSAESTQISTFLSTHPHVNSLNIPLHFQPPPPPQTTNKVGPDPFFLRYDAVSRSAHQIIQHLTSSLSPPPSAIFTDIMFVAGFTQELAGVGIPLYVLVTTSARFFCVASYLPLLQDQGMAVPNIIGGGCDGNDNEEVLVEFPPGLALIPKSSIPPIFFNPNHIFTKLLSSNSACLHKVNGIVFNTFDSFEPDTISRLQHHKLLGDLPMMYPIGPLRPMENDNNNHDQTNADDYLTWLDAHPAKSVMYVSFGSRTAMSPEQILELAQGLETSGVRFLWVVKMTTVDKDENKEDDDLGEWLGEGFKERTKERGMVLKKWVNQEKVLDHPSVGGFMTHCGWNSVMEAAERGMPVLAWPQHGDQKVNAGVVEKAGLGVWDKGWGWVGQRLVKSYEIARMVKVVITSDQLRKSATKVGHLASMAWNNNNNNNNNTNDAAAAAAAAGSSSATLTKIISIIKNNTNKQVEQN